MRDGVSALLAHGSALRSAVCRSIAPGELSRIPVLAEWELISLSKKALNVLIFIPGEVVWKHGLH